MQLLLLKKIYADYNVTMYLQWVDENDKSALIFNAVIFPRPLDGANDQQSHSRTI